MAAGYILMNKHWPLIAALGIFIVVSIIIMAISFGLNRGQLVYALDDAYIHMAIAKNVAMHGVWGVTAYEFSSSSSSLLWTGLLSGVYALVGPNEISPLLINIFLAMAVIALTYLILRKEKLQPFFAFIVLTVMMFLTSLFALVFSGMEHVLQVFLSILFVYLSAVSLANTDRGILPRGFLFILPVAAAFTSTRYEGFFVVLAVCLLMFLRRRLIQAIILGVIASLPASIYGLISVSKGAYWLPNSVILKGNMPQLKSIADIYMFLRFDGYSRFFDAPYLLVLILISLVLLIVRFFRKRELWDIGQSSSTIFLLICVLHLHFANIGHFFRYDAYLVALGIFVIAINLKEFLPDIIEWFRHYKISVPLNAVVTIILFLFSLPLFERITKILDLTPVAMHNIYDQQYQMGIFLEKYYQGQAVAANDIGAINYLADIKCLDIWGLGNVEITRMMHEGTYYSMKTQELAEAGGVQIAIVYDHWLNLIGGVPLQWEKAGVWRIPNNYICSSDSVSFYAVNSEAMPDLIANLRNFAIDLPIEVQQSGEYASRWPSIK
jgi:hypothetical protein